MVASRATISEMTDNVIIKAYSLGPGFQSSTSGVFPFSRCATSMAGMAGAGSGSSTPGGRGGAVRGNMVSTMPDRLGCWNNQTGWSLVKEKKEKTGGGGRK